LAIGGGSVWVVSIITLRRYESSLSMRARMVTMFHQKSDRKDVGTTKGIQRRGFGRADWRALGVRQAFH
jgi:hypothetical protein